MGVREHRFVAAEIDRRVLSVWQKLLDDPQQKIWPLAAGVGLSESYFQHLFVAQVGMSIREFKRQLKIERLHEARRQLIETNDPIVAIRERCGYFHESNFIRDFKRLFHWTPAGYRRHAI